MDSTTEQSCQDLISEQGKVITELEAERDKFKQFYLNSNEERAKLIVHLTNHVPVAETLRNLRESLHQARKAMQKALNWCTGKGEYADNKDNCMNLAEEVAPALDDAINSLNEQLK